MSPHQLPVTRSTCFRYRGHEMLRDGSHRLWLSARALVVNNSGSVDLWLSATGAVVNGGRWLRDIERLNSSFVPEVCCLLAAACARARQLMRPTQPSFPSGEFRMSASSLLSRRDMGKGALFLIILFGLPPRMPATGSSRAEASRAEARACLRRSRPTAGMARGSARGKSPAPR